MYSEQNQVQSKPHTKGQTIRWAPFYDTIVWLMSFGKDAVIRKKTVKLARINPGDRVLDVGCGTGDLTIEAKKITGPDSEVIGTDASVEMIEVAQRKAGRSGMDIQFQVEAIENISFPNNSFDVVISSLMMHHLPDELKVKGLAEVFRVLKPGGRILIVDIESSSGGSWLQKLSDFMIQLHGGHAQTRDYVKRLIPLVKSAGFREIESDKLNRQLSFITCKKPG